MFNWLFLRWQNTAQHLCLFYTHYRAFAHRIAFIKCTEKYFHLNEIENIIMQLRQTVIHIRALWFYQEKVKYMRVYVWCLWVCMSSCKMYACWLIFWLQLSKSISLRHQGGANIKIKNYLITERYILVNIATKLNKICNFIVIFEVTWMQEKETLSHTKRTGTIYGWCTLIENETMATHNFVVHKKWIKKWRKSNVFVV